MRKKDTETALITVLAVINTVELPDNLRAGLVKVTGSLLGQGDIAH